MNVLIGCNRPFVTRFAPGPVETGKISLRKTKRIRIDYHDVGFAAPVVRKCNIETT